MKREMQFVRKLAPLKRDLQVIRQLLKAAPGSDCYFLAAGWGLDPHVVHFHLHLMADFGLIKVHATHSRTTFLGLTWIGQVLAACDETVWRNDLSHLASIFDGRFVEPAIDVARLRCKLEQLSETCERKKSEAAEIENQLLNLKNYHASLLAETCDLERRAAGMRRADAKLRSRVAETTKKKKELEQAIVDRNRALATEYILPVFTHSQAIFISDVQLIPTFSGIYFAWDRNGSLQYVGKAKNIRKRLTGSHPTVRKNHYLGFVEIAQSELYYAEAYYIGILRPALNRGKPPIPRTS